MKGIKIWYNINMETILTIDFDIIMWENIESYNHMVEGISDDMGLISERMNIINSIQPYSYLFCQFPWGMQRIFNSKMQSN